MLKSLKFVHNNQSVYIKWILESDWETIIYILHMEIEYAKI